MARPEAVKPGRFEKLVVGFDGSDGMDHAARQRLRGGGTAGRMPVMILAAGPREPAGA